MDRNFKAVAVCGMLSVALRKESVDRNPLRRQRWRWPDQVALRKESVDRNNEKALLRTDSKVALRKESVDRNCSRGERWGD